MLIVGLGLIKSFALSKDKKKLGERKSSSSPYIYLQTDEAYFSRESKFTWPRLGKKVALLEKIPEEEWKTDWIKQVFMSSLADATFRNEIPSWMNDKERDWVVYSSNKRGFQPESACHTEHFSQSNGLKIRLSTFPNYKEFVDRRTLRLWYFEMFRHVEGFS